MRSSFARQVASLVQRNFLIKLRNKTQTVTEFVWPIFFIFLLAFVKYLSTPDIETEAVNDFPAKRFTFGHEEEISAPLILVAPPSAMSVMLPAMAYIQSGYNGTKQLMPFENGTKMDEWFVEQGKSAFAVFAGVIFHDNTSYEIRPLYSRSAGTDSLIAEAAECREGWEQCTADTYITSGFMELQLAIDNAILARNGIVPPLYYTQRMPKNKFPGDSSHIRSFAPIFYLFVFSFFIQFLLVNLVTEKKEKMKETMRIMGMRDSAFWASWILVYAVIIVLISSFAVLVAYLTKFFSPVSSMSLFFVLLVLYGLSVITLAFVLTPFFNNPKIAGPLASMATTAIGIIYFAISLSTTYDTDGKPQSPIPASVQWLLCLFSPVAFALGIERGLHLDIAQLGMTWDNLRFGVDQEGALPMYAHLTMLAVDTVLYFLLALYLDSVVPGEFGTRKHPLFCFMPSYWRKKKYAVVDVECSSDAEELSTLVDNEPVSEELKGKNAVRLHDIRKTFHSAGKTIHAVRGINLDIYEGQITCLLGHNGAGKTTLMNMLTGLLPPTSGSATIYGLDISDSNDMSHIREMTGVCPQANVLVNELTPKEHLRLFAGLKGVDPADVEGAVKQALEDVDLINKSDTIAKDLSGGQKRKLCVAIALIGDPKIIFLDEPSAGMDPYSRRHLWSLLKQKKQGRIILLTTHFMDEADLLSDRKAIVSKGQLRCCGSSIYLKTKFGAGYHLNFVVDPQTFTINRVSRIIHRHVPDAKLGHQHAAEVCYTLPYKDVHKFADLFNDIGEQQSASADNLGVTSYGISMTTLEEVFLKLGIEEEEEEEQTTLKQTLQNSSVAPAGAAGPSTSMHSPVSPELFTGKELAKRQFKALLQLRYLQVIRNKGAWFGRFMFPVLLVVAGMAVIKFSKTSDSNVDPPALKVGSDLLHSPIHPVAVFNNSAGNIDLLLSAISDQWPDNVDVYDSDVHLQDVKVHELGYTVSSFIQNVDINVTLHYNTSWRHTLPLLVNIMTNSLLSTVSTGANKVSVNVSIHPFKSIIPQPELDGSTFAFSLMIGFALVFVPASFAASVVKDRECKARSQVRISGVSSQIYWGSIWLVDLLQGMLLGVVVIALLLAFQIPSLSTNGAITVSALFFLLYIPLYMCIAYTLSYVFDKYEMAVAILPTIFLLMYMIPYMTIAIMIHMEKEWVRDMAKYLHYLNVFVNPIYTVSGIFFMISRLYIIESFEQQTLTPDVTFEMYMEWDNLIAVCFIPPVIWYIFLAVLMRMGEILKYGGSVRELCGKSGAQAINKENSDKITSEDNDVAEERRRVANILSAERNPAILVENIRKEYKSDKKEKKPFVAVRNSTFKVEPGEVFGLLGPNGAGKSTTLNLLTAETAPTAGTVKVGDTDIHSSLSDAYKVMGYCPQYDALWDGITLKEHLEIYATLRGLKKEAAKDIVSRSIEALCLQCHSDSRANKLSGGTKRKLSFAMSMLGDPKIVLLDEPSTGMDPQSKRVFWDTISSSFVGTDRGAILTTHYMEEADALCSRMAIMVNGVIECMGTGQHIKSKFGSGYTLELKLTSSNQNTESEDIDMKIQEIFPSAACLERFAERIVYRVDKSDVKSLGEAFAKIESEKNELGILDYSFSQATLEQVFLEFARHQVGEEGPVDEELEDLANLRLKMSEPITSASEGAVLANGIPLQQLDGEGNVEFGSTEFHLLTRESNI